LKQNGNDPRKPNKQRTNATKLLGTTPPQAVSQMTVDVASIAENDESIPSMNKVDPNKNAQNPDPGIISIAVGYVIKARPTDEVLVSFKVPYFSRYPTIAHTANPAMKLKLQFEIEITKLSRIIGFLSML